MSPGKAQQIDPMTEYRRQEYSNVLGEVANYLKSSVEEVQRQQEIGSVYAGRPTFPSVRRKFEEAQTFKDYTDWFRMALNAYIPYLTMESMAPGLASIKAFHGSPYKFTKFSSEKIGTGEGAQAFGYGHYLTESPEVAKHYALSGIENKVLWEKFKEKSPDIAKQFKKAVDDLAGIPIDNPAELGNQLSKMASGISDIKNQPILEKAVRFQINKHNLGGSLYETTIHKGKQPSEYTYLEWDKPVDKSLKPELIDKLYEQKMPFNMYQFLHDKKGNLVSGEKFYTELANRMGQQRASEILQQAGISGIKYPTGSLSGMKTKEYNYVVFNPEDITIESVK